MKSFYSKVIEGLVARGLMQRSMSILVVCGGIEDKQVFEALGFTRVTISNMDSRMKSDDYHPYRWCYQDAERLSFEDDSFDYGIVHSGLHHCQSPHRGLLELYRVAKHGVVLFEPYDNPITRLGVAAGFGQEHEHAAVYFDEKGFGGVRNTHIPNYVYRFTEREIEKTLQSFEPLGWHQIEFVRALRIPWVQLRGRKNKVYLAAVVAAYPLLLLCARAFPWACDNFAAVVLKLDKRNLHAWLRSDENGVTVDDAWLENRYKGGASHGRGS